MDSLLWYALDPRLRLQTRDIHVAYPARSSIISVLGDAITTGHLTISDSEGTHYYGRYQKGCNDVHLKVVNDNFWLRILL